MRQILWTGPLGFGLGLVALPALAQRPLTIEDVRAIAFDKGIVEIEEIKLKHGFWKVEGDDESGREIEIKVDAGSGAIVEWSATNLWVHKAALTV